MAHLGPTNSGKSHEALDLLATVGAGVYAAPLRLLAREGYERLRARLGPGRVGLRTGEERIDVDAPILCCTTELAPLEGEVLVLDEVHWVDDPDRGWAWGRLLAGASQRHVRLVGAANALPVLRAAFGDRLEVRSHRRLVELRWGGTVELGTVEPGSLVVAFSRRAVLALARDLAGAGGLRTGVLYGALPPGARHVQIERFLAGELDVLCVTDVIGHGINLPARTVVMAETSKYDGTRRRPLHLWELAQIIGRAGRFGLSEEGVAQVLRGVPGLDANATLVRQGVEAAGGQRATGPGITAAPIRPTFDDLAVDTPAALFDAVAHWEAGAAQALAGHPWLRAASLAPVARRLTRLRVEDLADRIGVGDLWRLATLSVDEDDAVVELARHLATGHRRLQPPRPVATERPTLEQAERDAARARSLAGMGRAFPALAAATPEELLALEEQAARRIVDVLPSAITHSPFGRCGSCGRACPAWVERCDRCAGRLPRGPKTRTTRPPRRRR